MLKSSLEANHTASIYYQQAGTGEVKLEIENGGWYSLINNEFKSHNKSFHLDLHKHLPFICLYFQIRGESKFVGHDTIRIPEKHHSLNYLPSFQSQYVVEKHTHVQDFSIKISPEVLTDKLLGKDIHEESWHKLIANQMPYVTLSHTHKMDPVIWDTLFQLLHCPYSGAVGQMYKELLVRMLFIHQIVSFSKEGKSVLIEDNKLHKRDVEVLHAIKEYLEKHYLDDLCLDKIVKEFGINTFKLKYGFKKLFGTSVMKFIDDKKMTFAKQLLLDSHTEVMEVAEKLGYNHYNNFSAAFKRKFGYSPTFFIEKEAYLAHI